MDEEYITLMSNDTWDLVPRPRGANVVTDKWIFKHKFKADVTLERYNAAGIFIGSRSVSTLIMMSLSTSL
jgi:hypothetical protein